MAYASRGVRGGGGLVHYLQHQHMPWNTQESVLRLSSPDVRLWTFLPYDLARLSGDPGLFFDANAYPLCAKSRLSSNLRAYFNRIR